MTTPASPADSTRRDFLKKASLSGLAAVSSPGLLLASPAAKGGKISLAANEVILFQGDSITDSSRRKDSKDANTQGILGTGYAYLAAAELLRRHAGKNLRIYNRGISGNKVYQLAERWEADCLELKPTVLSILVGVNDFWHMLAGKYQGTLQTYQDDYAALLNRTRQRLPEVRLIIGEPFAVPGVKDVDAKWYPAFQDFQAAARGIAAQFNATLIPYQRLFDEAQQQAPGSYWTGDGVHPSVAGAELMAHAWLETIRS